MKQIPLLTIPTLGNYKGLLKTIESIDFPIANLVVVDNGGQCPKIEHAMIDNLYVIRLPANLGVSTSWNLGIKLFPYCEWWLFTSDDRRFRPGAIKTIAETIGPNIFVDAGCDAKFSTFALHESVVDKIGLFDEFYYPGVGEEFSYGYRCELMGVQTIFIDNLTFGGEGVTRKHLITKCSGWDDVMIKNYAFSKKSKGQTVGFSLKHRRSRLMPDSPLYEGNSGTNPDI